MDAPAHALHFCDQGLKLRRLGQGSGDLKIETVSDAVEAVKVQSVHRTQARPGNMMTRNSLQLRLYRDR